MAKKQTVRSRNARQAASPPPELVDPSSLPSDSVDGKTRVLREVAKLQVRGAYKDDNDDDTLGAIKYAPALGIREAGSNSVGKISKKGSRKSKEKLTAKQRKRQADAIAKAESLKAVFENKVETSIERFSGIKQRKKEWEDYNKNVVAKTVKTQKKGKNDAGEEAGSSNPFALLDVDGDDNDDDNDEDNDEEK